MEQSPLFDLPVQEAICSYLTFPEAVQLREALCRSKLDCPISIVDQDQQIKSLPYVDSLTIEIYSQIEKYGLNETLTYAIHSSNMSMLRLLITRGINLNNNSNVWRSPLMEAIVIGNCEVIQLLINCGSDLTFQSPCQETPLSYAICHRNIDLVRLLFQLGVKPNRVDVTTILMQQENEIFELLVEFKLDIFPNDGAYDSHLSIAGQKGNINAVRILLDSGANIDFINDGGITALMEAVRQNQIKVVKLLLERGANVHIIGRYQETALSIANHRHHYYLTKLLKEAGA